MGLADLPAACCACSSGTRASARARSAPPPRATACRPSSRRAASRAPARPRPALPSLPRIIVERWLGADDWRVRLGALRSFASLGGAAAAPTGDSANIKAGYGEKFVAMRDHDPHPEVADFARRVVERIERSNDD